MRPAWILAPCRSTASDRQRASPSVRQRASPSVRQRASPSVADCSRPRTTCSDTGGFSMRNARSVLSALALTAALGAAVIPAAAQQSLTWTAGAVGGGWYAISGGMAELVREKAGLNIKVIPGGGTQNPVLVESG